MEVGRISVVLGFGASLVSILLYVLALRGNRKALPAARVAYGVTALCAAFCFGRLMWIVAHKQFQYHYVFKYVSRDLESPFLYAATWAGQEGSFLLWALWTGVIGALVAWKAGKWEARIMPIYVSVLTFLFAILTWLSPYALIQRGTGANDYPLNLPWPPPNGTGLNPSLQNYWMAIHPPTIFFGFASLAVPFAYALAAMLWREYDSWAGRVMPWVLMTVATLGVGLFMGGYWAYETQGWHGFWGWDPVENASLFPWLGALGMLHGLVVQKSRGGMGRTNLFLAVLAWMLFLYGTFLTRSGVLASVSVHAFDMLANSALGILIGMVACYGLAGFGMLIWRWKRIPGRPISDKALSRDTAMTLAVTLMIVACFVVLTGTSWPLISRWSLIKHIPWLPYSPKGVAVQPPFYNKIGSVLLIPTLIIMGMVPFLAWGKTNGDKFLWKVIKPWFLAIGVGVMVLAFIWHQRATGFQPDTPPMLVVAVGTLGAFAAIANFALAWKVLRVKSVTMGGWLAHAGIGLLFLGTVLTNVYENTVSMTLIEGDSPRPTPFGYSLQFAGWTHDGLPNEEREAAWWKFDHGVKLRIVPSRSNAGVAHADTGDASSADMKGSFVAVAPVFKNQQLAMNAEPGAQTMMKWPYIQKGWTQDNYVLVAEDPKIMRVRATLTPGQTVGIHPTQWKVRYDQFYMHGTPGQGGTEMGADMTLISPKGLKTPIHPGIRLSESGQEPINVDIPTIPAGVLLHGGVDPATKQATVEFELPDAPGMWMVPVAVTYKPWINLVWIGVILMGLGSLCAMVRRALEVRKGQLMAVAAAAGLGDVPVPLVGEPAVTNGNGNHSGSPEPAGNRAKPKRGARYKAASKH